MEQQPGKGRQFKRGIAANNGEERPQLCRELMWFFQGNQYH